MNSEPLDRLIEKVDGHDVRLNRLEHWLSRAVGGGIVLGVVITFFVWFVDTILGAV